MPDPAANSLKRPSLYALKMMRTHKRYIPQMHVQTSASSRVAGKTIVTFKRSLVTFTKASLQAAHYIRVLSPLSVVAHVIHYVFA